MTSVPTTHAVGEAPATLTRTAVRATLHCLTGCAIGEILGLVIGTATGVSSAGTVALSVGLAFSFGYLLSTLPLLRAGFGLSSVVRLVLAADTLSIAAMEVVDNAVMTLIPGAMGAGLLNPRFWVALAIALSAAFPAAYPVNLFLLRREKGHALTHEYLHGHVGGVPTGWHRHIPNLSTATLIAAIAAYLLGGFTAALTAELFENDGDPHAGAIPADPSVP